MRPFYERYEEFCAVEIQNVSIIVDDNTGQISCEAGTKDPDMYGVYMVLTEGTVEHVGDFPARAYALHYAQLILEDSSWVHEIRDKTFGDGE